MGSWSAPRPVPVSKISASHSVESGRKTPARYLDTPIYVKPRLFGGYRVHDGNHRLQLARQAGRSTIRAHIWQR